MRRGSTLAPKCNHTRARPAQHTDSPLAHYSSWRAHYPRSTASSWHAWATYAQGARRRAHQCSQLAGVYAAPLVGRVFVRHLPVRCISFRWQSGPDLWRCGAGCTYGAQTRHHLRLEPWDLRLICVRRTGARATNEPKYSINIALHLAG